MQAQREARVTAGLEVTPGLRGLEGAFLDEDVRRRGEPRGFREHLGQDEVEIRVGVGKLRRHGVRTEPGRYTSLRCYRTQRCELGLAVEPVARFRLERRRPGAQHPIAVPAHGSCELGLVRRPRGAHGREDPSPRGVQLLVGRTAGAQGELFDAIAGKACVRVAVHEPRDRTTPGAVDLLDRPLEALEVAHLPRSPDAPALAEDEGVLEHLDAAESFPAEGRLVPCRGHELREIADEQPRGRGRLGPGHVAAEGGEGSSRPCCSAAAIASG